MPSIHTKTFQARSYECNPFGELKPANYLRWMQETAFEASAALGYDFSRYTEMGQLWLIRETGIRYFKPLVYKDEVEIKTWVQDFRHFRSKRVYEFQKKGASQRAGRAITDWVFLDSDSFRPVPIPEEMKLAFFPEGLPQDPPRRTKFPKSSPQQRKCFTHQKTVGWRDIDGMWHVNNAAYLDYFEESDTTFCTKLGWSIQRIHAEGIRPDTCSQRIEYLQPAKYGDVLEITFWHADIQLKNALRYYEIHRVTDGELLVRAHSRWGFARADNGEPCNIPEEILRSISDWSGHS